MEMMELGSSGEQIPRIGYGTWMHLGGAATIQRALALDAGFIDTAESYDTERYVGEAVKGSRDAYFLATKVSPNHFAFDQVIAAAERSLKELGTGVIDLYQLHWPTDSVPIEETMGAMDKLVADGKVRHVGVSNFSVDQLRDAEQALGAGRVVTNQIKFSLLDHEFADEVVPYCRDHGVTIMSYSPLEEGAFQARIKERPRLATTIDAIAAEWQKTRAQVLLNWVLHEPNVMTIPRTNRVERVDENCNASGWRLTDAQHAALADASGEARTRRWWRP